MKKDLLLAVAVTALSASSVIAATYEQLTPAGGGVLGSVHDMNSVANAINKDAQGRVCAFCHTPHHAIVDATAQADYMPLWSHNLTTESYTQYGALSFTYDADDNVIDPLVGPTRLCMSCHDGLIAPDQHYGSANTGTKFPGNEFTGGVTGALQIGIGAAGALDRTHPIGFNLVDAIAADVTSNPAGGASGFVAGLPDTNYLGTSKPVSSQLFNGFMTCATCHDVHNKDNVVNDDYTGAGNIGNDHTDDIGRNYLVFAKQAGSQLCLSCHNK